MQISNIKFQRFGGLSPVKQTQYDASHDASFHSPPRKKGIYAFPQGFIERFLLGSTLSPKHVSGKSQWVKYNSVVVCGEYDKFYSFDETMLIENPTKLLKTICKRNNMSLKYCNLEHDYTDENHINFYKLSYLKPPKTFKYTGELWHHLDTVPTNAILKTHGSWVLTSYRNYIKGLLKHIHSEKRHIHSNRTWNNNYTSTFRSVNINSGIYRISLDHYEVFIERIP